MKLFLIIIFITLSGCQNSGRVYNSEKYYIFEISTNYTVNKFDTLKLFVVDKLFSNFKLKWELTEKYDNKTIRTSIEDRFWENSEEIIIHPPESSFLNKTVLLPPPNVKFPLMVGKTWDWDGDIDSKNKYNGAELKGKISVNEKVNYIYNSLNLDSWSISATGQSKYGNYNYNYYYNDLHGFIYFKYQFDNKIIEINLNTIKTTRKL